MPEPGKLKILYVITKGNFGGAQRYVHDLALAARADGHQVLVAFGGGGALGEMLRAAGVRTVSLPELGRDVSPWADLRSFVKLFQLIRDVSPDVVHLNSSKVGALGALAVRTFNLTVLLASLSGHARHRVAAVFTGHGWAFNEERGRCARLFFWVVHWFTLQLAHRVIAVSGATRAQVASMPFVRKKLVVVHNGVARPALDPPDVAWGRVVSGTSWEHRHPTKPTLVVGTLSELHTNKGLTYAIEAVRLVKARGGVGLAFVVLGEGELKEALAAEVVRLGLEDTVLLAGYRRGAPQLLAAFDVFLLASITEAFPYALLEAGSAGLPIVATRVGGVTDLVEEGETGLLVPPRSSEAIARALEALARSPEARQHLSERVRERVEARFTLSKMTSSTFSVYRTAGEGLARPAAPAVEAQEEQRPGIWPGSSA